MQMLDFLLIDGIMSLRKIRKIPIVGGSSQVLLTIRQPTGCTVAEDEGMLILPEICVPLSFCKDVYVRKIRNYGFREFGYPQPEKEVHLPE